MSVVGIDPSLTTTGVCVGTSMITVTSSPNGATVKARRDRLYKIISDVWDKIDPAADLVVIESPSLGQARQGGTLDRNGLWWLLVDLIMRQSIPLVDATPATVKKFATGKGNATKADMRMALYQRTGIDCRDDNQVDAWWLHQVGLHLTGHPDRLVLPKTHLAALDKINWPAVTA